LQLYLSTSSQVVVQTALRLTREGWPQIVLQKKAPSAGTGRHRHAATSASAPEDPAVSGSIFPALGLPASPTAVDLMQWERLLRVLNEQGVVDEYGAVKKAITDEAFLAAVRGSDGITPELMRTAGVLLPCLKSAGAIYKVGHACPTGVRPSGCMRLWPGEGSEADTSF